MCNMDWLETFCKHLGRQNVSENMLKKGNILVSFSRFVLLYGKCKAMYMRIRPLLFIKPLLFDLLQVDLLCLNETKACNFILFHIWFISLPFKWHHLDSPYKMPRSLRTEGNQAVNGEWGHIKSQVPRLSCITYAIALGSTMAWGIDF